MYKLYKLYFVDNSTMPPLRSDGQCSAVYFVGLDFWEYVMNQNGDGWDVAMWVYYALPALAQLGLN